MTEREPYREGADGATRREVYRETVREDIGTPVDATRELSRERAYGAGGEYVAQTEHVSVPSESARRAQTARRIQQVISFVVGTIVTLVAIRFILLALGAGQGSPFVQLIYGVTLLFVAPFFGIFGEPTVGASVIEWASLVAIAIYGLIGYGLNRLVDISYRPARATRY